MQLRPNRGINTAGGHRPHWALLLPEPTGQDPEFKVLSVYQLRSGHTQLRVMPRAAQLSPAAPGRRRPPHALCPHSQLTFVDINYQAGWAAIWRDSRQKGESPGT